MSPTPSAVESRRPDPVAPPARSAAAPRLPAGGAGRRPLLGSEPGSPPRSAPRHRARARGGEAPAPGFKWSTNSAVAQAVAECGPKVASLAADAAAVDPALAASALGAPGRARRRRPRRHRQGGGARRRGKGAKDATLGKRAGELGKALADAGARLSSVFAPANLVASAGSASRTSSSPRSAWRCSAGARCGTRSGSRWSTRSPGCRR